MCITAYFPLIKSFCLGLKPFDLRPLNRLCDITSYNKPPTHLFLKWPCKFLMTSQFNTKITGNYIRVSTKQRICIAFQGKYLNNAHIILKKKCKNWRIKMYLFLFCVLSCVTYICIAQKIICLVTLYKEIL